MKRRILPALLCAALSAYGSLSAATMVAPMPQVQVQVRIAPPSPRVEVAPAAVAQGYAWTPGYWFWNASQGRYDWVGGQLQRVPQPNVVWSPARWDFRNGLYNFRPGAWQPQPTEPGGVTIEPVVVNPGYPMAPPPPPMPRPMVLQPAQPMVLAPGMTVQGTLAYGDAMTPQGNLGDDYVLNLAAGQSVVLNMSGGASFEGTGNIDAYLRVLFNGVEVAHDDDSGGNLNARLLFTAPSAGTYVVRATTYGSSVRQGNYTLNVQWAPPVVQPGVVQGISAVLRPGLSATGHLDGTDLLGNQGHSYADDYAIDLTAGMPLTIVTRGGPRDDGAGTLDVVTSIYLNGQQLAQNDDGAGYPNSRIVFTAPTSGRYIIRVTSYGSTPTAGTYDVLTWPFPYPDAR